MSLNLSGAIVEMKNLKGYKPSSTVKKLEEPKKLDYGIKRLVDEGTIRADQADVLTPDQAEYLLKRDSRAYSEYFQVY